MTRARLVLVLGAIGALSLGLRAAQQPAQPQGPKVIDVEKVKDNLYMLKGGGGNTAVYVGANGVTVVDAKNPGWGQPILDKIKELTPKPVTLLINTHTHGDHVSGNVEFPATVDIVVQENTKANMEKMDIFKEHKGHGLPKKTFKDKMTLGSGGDRIDLYYFGRGHTNGDAWVVFPALRVMHAGDMFAGKSIPIMDSNAGGSGVEFAETLTKAFNTVKGVDTIITGHSATTMSMDDLKVFADFNRDFVNAVRDAKKAGKSVDDVAGSWKTPEKYTGYGAAQPASVKNGAQVIFNELK